MYKEDLALNNLQWLICHKTQPNLLSIKLITLGYYDRNFYHGTGMRYSQKLRRFVFRL